MVVFGEALQKHNFFGGPTLGFHFFDGFEAVLEVIA